MATAQLLQFPSERPEVARRAHQPDAVNRRQVEALAGYGVPEAEIAGLVGIDPKTLRKHYRHELDHGHTKANAKVAENLFRKATGDGRDSVIAAIFWLKARARWKETNIQEIENKQPLVVQIQRFGEPVEAGHAAARSPQRYRHMDESQ